MPTVLVVGASGNIGVAAVIGALRSKLNVLALVRNQSSADKLFQHCGTKEGITTVEADVASEDGVQGVVDMVKAGKLPAFQHVFSTVGLYNPKTPLHDLTIESFRETVRVNLEPNYFAYRATIPYLLEQGDKNSTWTLMTGAAFDFGAAASTAVGQGGLVGMANVASRELADTNVRFNELWLAYRVDYDSVCEKLGGTRMKSSDFGKVYQGILADAAIKGSRVSVQGPSDLVDIKYKSKL